MLWRQSGCTGLQDCEDGGSYGSFVTKILSKHTTQSVTLSQSHTPPTTTLTFSSWTGNTNTVENTCDGGGGDGGEVRLE